MKKTLRKKKIAFFHELDKGGARRSSNEFARLLKSAYDIDLFIIDEKKNSSEEEFYNKTHFYKFIPKKWEGNNWKVKLYKDTLELVKVYSLHKEIAEKINKGKYDAVFVFPSRFTQAPFILRLLKKPTIYYCQEPLRMVYEDLFRVGKEVGLGRYYYEKLNRLNRKIIDRTNIKNAKKILANSEYTKGNINSAYKLDSEVVYMGVNARFFKPLGNKKVFDILYVGAYDKADNFDLLISTLDSMHFNMKKLRAVIKEKEWISSDTEMRKVYCDSKVLVCLGYKEPFGLLPIEAMSCGLPVVALNDGGYKETVRDGKNGILIGKSKKSLRMALEKILNNKKVYEDMAGEARKIAEESWTWSSSRKSLVSAIESVMKK